MAGRRPDTRRKRAAPPVTPVPTATPVAPARRVGMLNRIGNAPWWVAVGLGVLLLAVGVYRDQAFLLMYGGIMIGLGVVLRIKRGR
jgi:hypothetical protein